MTKRRKRLIGLAIAVPILVAALYLIGNVVLTVATRRALASLVVPARQSGVELMLPDFDKARIAGFRSASWDGLRATVALSERIGFNTEEQFLLSVDEATLQLVGNGVARVEAHGVSAVRIIPGEDEGEPGDQTEETEDRIAAESVIIHLPVQLRKPGKSLRTFVPHLVTLLVEGVAPVRVMTHGTFEFSLHGKSIELPFSIITVDNQSQFSLEPDDVKGLAVEFSEDLTDAEAQVVAEQPMKAPNLLRIKNDAERTSHLAAQKNANVPEDAYRHVLWSYLLTQRFGPDFARKVTDAHETGATRNTAADHRMDYRNNEVGRDYASEGIPRSEVLARLQTDARVIRSPQ